MPYITQSRRDELKRLPVPETAGELNYLITLELIKAYADGGIHIQTSTIFKMEVEEIIDAYLEHSKPSYQLINDVLGALSGAAREFSRRVPKRGISNTCPYFERQVYIDTLELISQQFYKNVAVPYENKKIAENGDVYP